MYRDITELLSKHNLKEALNKLGEFAGQTECWQMKSEIDNLKTTYDYMLQYASQGIQDPSRKDLYSQILRGAYAMGRKLEVVSELEKGTNYLSGKYRGMKNSRTYSEIFASLESVSEELRTAKENKQENVLSILQKKQYITDELFNKTWVPAPWSKEDYQAASNIIDSEIISSNTKAIMISAICLSLTYVMDIYRMRLLIHSYTGNFDHIITQRALTCLVISLLFTEEQIKESYPELDNEISLIKDKEGFSDDLHTIIKQIILSLDTEEIDKKMRDEIIPSIMSSSYFKKSVEDIIEIKADDFTEKNPQWKNLKENIQELDNLRIEGADTNMSTFSQLKKYPFFNEPAHWFYPYSTDTPEIYELMNKADSDYKSILESVMEFPDMCNSDRYSLCLTLKTMSQFPMEGLKEGLSAQYNMIKGQQAALGNNKFTKETISRHFIQDFYRFCKLWSNKNDRKDIFTDKLTVWKTETVYKFLEENGKLKSIADYLFSKDYITDSLEIYKSTVETNPLDVESFQKIGYAYIKNNDYNSAVKALNTANMLDPDNEWTLQNLAICYKKTNQADIALKYLKEAEALNPDNIKICNQIGITLIQLEQFEEAIKYMFKVEYFSKKKTPAQRAIAWCYFMTGKYDEAVNMYNKIIASDDVRSEDYLNLGHIYLLKNDMSQSLELYRKSTGLLKNDESFHSIFAEDTKMLSSKGISEEMIYMIPDML